MDEKMNHIQLIKSLQDGQEYDYPSGDLSDMSFIMSEAADAIVGLEIESKRLDWFEKNNHLILKLGTSWYVRKNYGEPWMKEKTLREAIDVGMAFVSE